MTLELLADHLHQRDLVAVLVLLRIEGGRLLLDERFGKLQHLGIRFADRNVAEIIRRAAHLVGIAQGADEHSGLARTDGHHTFAAGQHETGDREFPASAQSFTQDDEGFLGHGPVGRQVIRGVLIDDVNGTGVDESLDVHRVIGFDPDAFQIRILDDDVFLVFVFVALHEVRTLDEAELRIDGLHVDPVMGVLVKLIEGNALACAGGGVKPHRTAHETQSDIALPTCPGCHGFLPTRHYDHICQSGMRKVHAVSACIPRLNDYSIGRSLAK